MRRAGTRGAIASRPARRFADDDRSDLVVVTCFCLVSECVSGVSECITGGRPGGRVPTESRPAQTSRGPIERCFRAVRSRANFARAQGFSFVLVKLSFCLESKAIKTGEYFAGRTAADTHVYSRPASGAPPPRRPGRLEKSHNGPSRNNRLSTARARTPRAGAANFGEMTTRRHQISALARI